MTDKNQNLETWAGNSVQINISITNSTTASGMDLTTASSIIWHLIADAETTSPAIISKSTGGSGITVSGSIASIEVGKGETDNLAGTYTHQCRVTDTSGSTVTVTVGTVTVNKSI
jgi:hypothetical protein